MTTAARPSTPAPVPIVFGIFSLDDAGQVRWDVELYQTNLNKKLHSQLKVDGVYGPKTALATLAFQKTHHLKTGRRCRRQGDVEGRHGQGRRRRRRSKSLRTLVPRTPPVPSGAGGFRFLTVCSNSVTHRNDARTGIRPSRIDALMHGKARPRRTDTRDPAPQLVWLRDRREKARANSRVSELPAPDRRILPRGPVPADRNRAGAGDPWSSGRAAPLVTSGAIAI